MTQCRSAIALVHRPVCVTDIILRETGRTRKERLQIEFECCSFLLLPCQGKRRCPAARSSSIVCNVLRGQTEPT